MNQEDFTVDEAESRRLLQKLKDEVFGETGGDGELALAMGRPVEEIRDWLNGGEIDEDAQMKINGIAKERLSGE
jgi:hypothetical protein